MACPQVLYHDDDSSESILDRVDVRYSFVSGRYRFHSEYFCSTMVLLMTAVQRFLQKKADSMSDPRKSGHDPSIIRTENLSHIGQLNLSESQSKLILGIGDLAISTNVQQVIHRDICVFHRTVAIGGN